MLGGIRYSVPIAWTIRFPVYRTVKRRHRTGTMPSTYEIYKLLERSLGINEWGSLYTPFITRTDFYGSILYIALGQESLGTERLCQIPDTEPDDIDKTKYRIVPPGGKPEYPLPRKYREIYLPFRTAPCHRYAEYRPSTRYRGYH